LIIWIDAQLSPLLSKFIISNFDVDCFHVRDLGFRDSSDQEIFMAARANDVIVMTKDSDFQDLLIRYGPPPKIIWITTGNSSNQQMRLILSATLKNAFKILANGEDLVEITIPA